MCKSGEKYLSNFSVHLVSGRYAMISASQFAANGSIASEAQEVINNSHIYLIGKTLIVSYGKDSIKYENGILSGKFNYKINGELKEEDFSFPFFLCDGGRKVTLSNYPYRDIIILDENDNTVGYLSASAVYITHGYHLKNNDMSDIEVLYVGQAYGDGKRTSWKRLQNHSTLTNILAQAHNENPDYEIQILMFEYFPYRIITKVDRASSNTNLDYNDLDKFRKINENPLSVHEQICLIEASLIRYFQPKYNKVYKDSFPNGKFKILARCYDLDFSGLIVEINIKDLGFRLYSSTIIACQEHTCMIDLIDPQDRRGFFYDGGFKFPNVIRK